MEVFKNIIYELIIQTVTVVQLFSIVEVFIDRNKQEKKHLFLSLSVCVIISTIFSLNNNILHVIVPLIHIMLILKIYKGTQTRKIFIFCIAFICIIIAEQIALLMRQTIQTQFIDPLIVQFISMSIILVITIILKAINQGKKSKDIEGFLKNKEVIMMSIISVLSALLLGGCIQVYGGKIEVVGSTFFLVGVIVSILVLNIGIITLMDRNIYTRYYKALNDVNETLIIQQSRYYDQVEKNQREVRAIKHDMHNHILCIKALCQEEKNIDINRYIQDLEEDLLNITQVIHTGNTIVDAIVNNKLEYANKKKIDFSVDMVVPPDIQINKIDLCTVIANAIDNAIEASEKVIDQVRREIKILAQVKQGYFILYIKNGFEGQLNIDKGNQITTTKENKLHHGYGLKNIEKSVKRYKGEMIIQKEEGYFILKVAMKLS